MSNKGQILSKPGGSTKTTNDFDVNTIVTTKLDRNGQASTIGATVVINIAGNVVVEGGRTIV